MGIIVNEMKLKNDEVWKNVQKVGLINSQGQNKLGKITFNWKNLVFYTNRLLSNIPLNRLHNTPTFLLKFSIIKFIETQENVILKQDL